MLGHSLDGLPWDGGAMPFYDDNEDMKMVHDMGQDINNRVGGGAGKRLSLAELQVCYLYVLLHVDCCRCGISVSSRKTM